MLLSLLVRSRVRVSALRDDRGATAVEYALMVGLIAVAILGAVTFLGSSISTLFDKTATSV